MQFKLKWRDTQEHKCRLEYISIGLSFHIWNALDILVFMTKWLPNHCLHASIRTEWVTNIHSDHTGTARETIKIAINANLAN